MVGCCVPDWLSAADRKCRVRENRAKEFVAHSDPFVASLAQGIVQHHHDDHWFHQTQTFAEMSMLFAVQAREELPKDSGFRTSLLGHIVIELLLDAYLNQQHPGKLNLYYEQVASVDAKQLQETVNMFAPKSTEKLVDYHRNYISSRFLFDYSDDAKLLYRLNGVMKRVKLNELDESILPWLGTVRKRVYDKAEDLLNEYAVPVNG